MGVSDKTNNPDRRDEPLELGRGAATKADLADVARWLEQRLGAARTDITALRENIDAHRNMVSDHLILIRTDLTGLHGEIAKVAGETRWKPGGPQRVIGSARGRLRWMLVVILAFCLGLAVPVDQTFTLLRLMWADAP